MKINFLLILGLVGFAAADWAISQYSYNTNGCDVVTTATYQPADTCTMTASDDDDDDEPTFTYFSCNDTHLVEYDCTDDICEECTVGFAIPIECTSDSDDDDYYYRGYCSSDAPPVESSFFGISYDNDDCTGNPVFVSAAVGACTPNEDGATYSKYTCNEDAGTIYVCSDSQCKHCKPTATYYPQTCTESYFYLSCDN